MSIVCTVAVPNANESVPEEVIERNLAQSTEQNDQEIMPNAASMPVSFFSHSKPKENITLVDVDNFPSISMFILRFLNVNKSLLNYAVQFAEWFTTKRSLLNAK